MRRLVTGLFIAAFFLAFTWRGMRMYFTGDDMMNLYNYWTRPASQLLQANIFFWTPYYRPFGGLVYRTVFALFGFHPRPLYIIYYASLLLNLYVAYLVLKTISGSAETGALATLLWSVHGNLDYLYYNAGSMYDVYSFLFFFLAVLIYARVRARGEFLKGWSLVAFIACAICSLNSKEMGATLPAVLLLYEVLFYTPRWRGARDLGRWLTREGRGALAAGICLLGYIPAKLSSKGLTATPQYVPHFNWATYVHDTAVYLGHLTYSHPFTPARVIIFYAVLATVAGLLRSRLMWFGLLFFQITLLPVSFVSAREGFVLYLPLAGLALYAAVLLVWIKDRLLTAVPLHAAKPAAGLVLFLATALLMGMVNRKHWRPAPASEASPIRITKEQLSRIYPVLPRGARLLFVHTPLDGGFYDLFFVLRLFYLDNSLFITQMNGPPAQRIPQEQLGRYDHIFDFVAGRFVELDNTDTQRSVRLNLVKEDSPGAHLGESMSVAADDAYKYFVKDVILCPPKSVSCWTLDSAELKFRLSSREHRTLTARFTIIKETLQQTGPLTIDFFVNDRFLEQARYAAEGDYTYRHAVPSAWLKTDDYTLVRIKIRNPYIAPADGAKLGVLLASAGFEN